MKNEATTKAIAGSIENASTKSGVTIHIVVTSDEPANVFFTNQNERPAKKKMTKKEMRIEKRYQELKAAFS